VILAISNETMHGYKIIGAIHKGFVVLLSRAVVECMERD
jgi:hypothetical protein